MTVYKVKEYDTFLKLIESGQVGHWVQIAEVLGVDKNTITSWKKLPEAQTAIIKGISKSLEKMEHAGKNDWRMWETKLKMLGLGNKIDIRTETKIDPIKAILKAYGVSNDEEQP